jgi:hypothetical protein
MISEAELIEIESRALELYKRLREMEAGARPRLELPVMEAARLRQLIADARVLIPALMEDIDRLVEQARRSRPKAMRAGGE